MFHVVNIKALVLKIIDEINAYLLTSRASMINDHDLVVSTPLGKFPEQPLLLLVVVVVVVELFIINYLKPRLL